MKSAAPALVAYLNAFRPTSDATLNMADLFTITLAGGTVLTYTNFDVPVVWNGYTYSASGLLIDGLKYKCSCGVNVDQQKITICARGTDTYGGLAVLQALQQGLFDAAEIQRERAFFTSLASPAPLTPLGAVILFKGRVSAIDAIGRTGAEVTVSSDLVLLDIDMPRNVFQANCTHVLYDSGCALARAAFTANGAVAAGSTPTQINWSGASSAYQQGAIAFTSGANAGVEATIRAATSSALTLVYPLPDAPAVGDSFTVSQGCDHTMATCQGKFANLVNFRGFPFVPPPQVITGPMASTYTSGK